MPRYSGSKQITEKTVRWRGSKAYAELNAKHRRFLNLALEGHNVVLLGLAGTGKTSVLKRLIQLLKTEKKVTVTSSSGISALLLDMGQKLCTLLLASGRVGRSN